MGPFLAYPCGLIFKRRTSPPIYPFVYRLVALSAIAFAVLGAATASGLPPVNPANKMLNKPIDEAQYDQATHCTKRPTRGILALQSWLQNNARGVSWGIIRC